MADIRLHSVAKEYPNGFRAIHEVDLTVADGEFLVLVGPSGCGKSTLLRMIAGLEDVTSGGISIGGREVTDAPPRERNIAMVFQSYALYPHMTVGKNIGYPLKLAKMAQSEIDERVRLAAETLQLTDVLDRRPGQLSGGQRQRVAMGRAIVRNPAAFLMDEPLSNLDAKLRVQMRAEIARLQREFGTTTVYVTHDQVEAMTMGHRVAVMNAGVVVQCDTPRRLYNEPANLFVAAFIGSPAMNLLSGSVVRRDERLVVTSGTLEVPLDPTTWTSELVDGQTVIIGLRPEALSVGSVGACGPTIDTVVDFVEELGSELIVHCTASVVADVPEAQATLEAANDGRQVRGSGSNCVAKLPAQTQVGAGERLTLRIDAAQLHLFDPSGPSLRSTD